MQEEPAKKGWVGEGGTLPAHIHGHTSPYPPGFGKRICCLNVRDRLAAGGIGIGRKPPEEMS